jgi:hypothetical protein
MKGTLGPIVRFTCLLLALHFTLSSRETLAQSRVPNPNAPAILRQWPVSGNWVTTLGRGEDGALICSMMTAKVENGRVDYLIGMNEWPTETHVFLSDIGPVVGKHIRVVIDGVQVADFQITKRLEGGPLHTAGAVVPATESGRLVNLFRTGATVQFITDQVTYTFPLAGAAGALLDMAQCKMEATNLSQQKAPELH